MHRIRAIIIRVYYFAQHPAVVCEKPLHMCYFAFVALESHHIYGYLAGSLAIATLFTFREKRD